MTRQLSIFTLAQIHAHRERYARRRMARLNPRTATDAHAYVKLAHVARLHSAAIERLAGGAA